MAPRTDAVGTPPLLTVTDVAAKLQLSTKTVRRMMFRGDLPFMRVGRQLRVAPNELAAFIQYKRVVVST